jgi:sugar transferase (PEP-CTERM system associated)
MIRLFRHYIPKSVFVLGVVETGVLLASIWAGLVLRYADLGFEPPKLSDNFPEVVTYVVVIYLSMLAVGLYHRDAYRDLRMAVIRLIIAFVVSFVVLSVIFFLYPDVTIWRSIFAISFFLAFAGVLVARLGFYTLVGRGAFKRRLLVLGAGERAWRIQELEQEKLGDSFQCVAFIRMGENEKAVKNAHERATINSLLAFAREHNIDEIVTAMEERRGSMPVRELLDCKFAGLVTTDFTSFMERETGKVDLASLNPSWLIYSDGNGRGRIDYLLKRGIDILASLVLLIFTLPILIVTALLVKLTSPGPVFYRQERTGQYGKPFMLLKFRSMTADAEKDGVPQWARKGDSRVTPVGGVIRLTRIDEIPQIFNVLKGDMSFVGPRPERPFFVDTLASEIAYYPERHHVKPGITGWAQLNYPYGASVEDAKQKLQYDLYYIKNYSIFLDMLIGIQTVRVVLFPDGAR